MYTLLDYRVQQRDRDWDWDKGNQKHELPQNLITGKRADTDRLQKSRTAIMSNMAAVRTNQRNLIVSTTSSSTAYTSPWRVCDEWRTTKRHTTSYHTTPHHTSATHTGEGTNKKTPRETPGATWRLSQPCWQHRQKTTNRFSKQIGGRPRRRERGSLKEKKEGRVEWCNLSLPSHIAPLTSLLSF